MSFGLNSHIFQAFTFVLLSSQNFSFTSSSSSIIILTTLSGFNKISFKSAIKASFSANSASIFSFSSHCNLLSFISTIASA
ncbi:MAG: hypothetical protein LBQ24_04975 [Candidatus Peribacteria bacterium]|nr:hypothetical protein [Candidatus Peribacteria bacterium]